jgi:hypothetical protein
MRQFQIKRNNQEKFLIISSNSKDLRMIGKTISHYMVLEKIGEGRMEMVYKV